MSTGTERSADGAEVAPSGMFVRQATGLVRQMGAWDALSLAIGAIAPGLGFVAFFYMLGIFPRASLVVSFLLGFIASLLLGLVYIQLVSSMPRTGGDYVFVSRLIHPALGAAVAGALFLIFATYPAFWAVNFGVTHLAEWVAAFGSMIGSTELSSWATEHLTGQTFSFLAGSALVLVLAAVAVASTKSATAVLRFVFVSGTALLLVALVVLATSSGDDFRQAFNAENGAGSYGAVIEAGRQVGYTGGYSLGDTLGALPYVLLLILGFTWAAYPGGELRNAAKTMKTSVFGSTGIAIGIFILAAILANSVIGSRFMAAATYVSTQFPDQYPVDAAPSMTAYVAMLSGSGVVQFLIASIAIVFEVGLIMTYFLTTSRILFAMSFDRLLPAELRTVSRRGTPAVAIGVVAVSILVMLALAAYTSALTVWSNGTLGIAIVFVFVSLSALSLVHRFPKVWNAGPRVLPQRVAGVPGISIVAVLSTAFFLVIVGLAIFKPLGIGPMTWKSAVALVVAFTWGPAVYFAVRAAYRSRGQDVDAVLREIPAE